MSSPSHDFPSKIIGSVHKTLLGVALLPYLLTAIFTLFYVFDYETYLNLFSDIDQVLMSFSGVLYLIILVTYFIWLVKVHAAFRQKYIDYEITAIGGIVRMLPIVFLWGLANTYNRIGNFLAQTSELEKTGRYIKSMVIPLYIAVFVGNGVNRFLLRNPAEASDGMILTGAILDLSLIVVCFLMTRAIHSGISLLYSTQDVEAAPYSEANSHKDFYDDIQTAVNNAIDKVEPSKSIISTNNVSVKD